MPDRIKRRNSKLCAVFVLLARAYLRKVSTLATEFKTIDSKDLRALFLLAH